MLEVPAELSSAATVRHHIADDLAAQGICAELIDDVVLVASELVANAVRHGESSPAGTVSVRWEIDETGVRLYVIGGVTHHKPRLRHAAPLDTSGRGLSIVVGVADGWGVEDTDHGTAVWAHLPQPEHARR